MLIRAILWTNGQVMAFDEHGQQVPEYQGTGYEMIPKIRKDHPDCPIMAGDWATDVVPYMPLDETNG